jgi:ubiquinone/menaquinone biosynthesis C-methylase UbiE
MESTLKHSHEGRHGTGITLDAFRLNSAFNHVMFAGSRGRVYQQIVRLSGVRPGDSVLDVGSSSGYLTHRLATAAEPSGRVTGVDPSESAIAYARRHARPGTSFIIGIAQDLDLPDASMDVVTCTLAMHHIPALQRPDAVAEMYRVTKPGGRLLIADVPSFLFMHLGGWRKRRTVAAAGPLEELAITAGYDVESAGKLPLLSYVVAVRP